MPINLSDWMFYIFFLLHPRCIEEALPRRHMFDDHVFFSSLSSALNLQLIKLVIRRYRDQRSLLSSFQYLDILLEFYLKQLRNSVDESVSHISIYDSNCSLWWNKLPVLLLKQHVEILYQLSDLKKKKKPKDNFIPPSPQTNDCN